MTRSLIEPIFSQSRGERYTTAPPLQFNSYNLTVSRPQCSTFKLFHVQKQTIILLTKSILFCYCKSTIRRKKTLQYLVINYLKPNKKVHAAETKPLNILIIYLLHLVEWNYSQKGRTFFSCIIFNIKSFTIIQNNFALFTSR